MRAATVRGGLTSVGVPPALMEPPASKQPMATSACVLQALKVGWVDWGMRASAHSYQEYTHLHS